MSGWLKRVLKRSAASQTSQAVAIMDAATIYGAGRFYFEDHNNPNWEYKAEFKLQEDKILFEDLLQDIILYERMLLDDSCTTERWLRVELHRIIDKVNSLAQCELISLDAIAPRGALIGPVVEFVCKIVADIKTAQGSQGLQDGIGIPWYYRTKNHIDYELFCEAAKAFGLDAALVPLSLFVYRGLCYSGYANHYHRRTNVPIVYLASPGRLRALQPIISSEVMTKLKYPHEAYADLVSLLELPEKGYDFTHLGLSPSHASSLAILLASQNPVDALQTAFRIRESFEGRALREAWAKRIWSTSGSCAVGTASASNVISGAVIQGNVTMIHASACGVS